MTRDRTPKLEETFAKAMNATQDRQPVADRDNAQPEPTPPALAPPRFQLAPGGAMGVRAKLPGPNAPARPDASRFRLGGQDQSPAKTFNPIAAPGKEHGREWER